MTVAVTGHTKGIGAGLSINGLAMLAPTTF